MLFFHVGAAATQHPERTEEYNTIYSIAQSDPAIAQQIEGHINALVQQ